MNGGIIFLCFIAIGFICFFIVRLIDRIFNFNIFLVDWEGKKEKGSLGLFIVLLWPVMIPLLFLAGLMVFINWFCNLFVKKPEHSGMTHKAKRAFFLSKLLPGSEKSCMKCSRMTKDYKDVVRYYYLDRPFNCCPEMFDKEFNKEGDTPESFARECEKYTTERLFEENYNRYNTLV